MQEVQGMKSSAWGGAEAQVTLLPPALRSLHSSPLTTIPQV